MAEKKEVKVKGHDRKKGQGEVIADTKSYIIPDSPLESIEEIEDVIIKGEMQRFIETVSSYINSYLENNDKEKSPKKSLTIGLEGSWGSGKTSILNMIKDKLKKQTIIDFNPWYFTDTSNLISLFFSQLSLSLKNEDKFAKVAESLMMISDALSVGGSIISMVNPVLGQLVSAGGNIGKFSSQHANRTNLDLTYIKNKLSEKLKELISPIIIVIDDLDRLHPPEIREMLKAIRSIGNLPNIVYILAYDRDIVSKSLTTDSGINGSEFLEKIIQVKLSVPAHNESAISKYIMDGLLSHRLLTDEKTFSLYENTIKHHMRNHINSYRKAKQLVNRLSYRLRYQQKQLCDYDLFLLSFLEIHDPEVVSIIQETSPVESSKLTELTKVDYRKSGMYLLMNGLLRHYGLEEIRTGNDNHKIDLNQVITHLPYPKYSRFRSSFEILNLLFELLDIVKDSRNLTIDLSWNTTELKYRLNESDFFPYYFEYCDDRKITHEKYLNCIKRINDGESDFKTDFWKEVLENFLERCAYRYDNEHIATYHALLESLMTYSSQRAPRPKPLYDAIVKLLSKCLDVEENREKLINILLKDSIQVEYLIETHDHIIGIFVPRLRKSQNTYHNYKPKVISQIGINVKKQDVKYSESIVTNKYTRCLRLNQGQSPIDQAYNDLANNEHFIVKMLMSVYCQRDGESYIDSEKDGWLNRPDVTPIHLILTNILNKQLFQQQEEGFRKAVEELVGNIAKEIT